MRHPPPYGGARKRIVSIHAPREGCDLGSLLRPAPEADVSIHAPREGCDIVPDSDYSGVGMFQFTHPGRGATRSMRCACWHKRFQFTHPGRGATVGAYPPYPGSSRFNSRTPGGVRLVYWLVVVAEYEVSIHAPREGCDKANQMEFKQEQIVSIHAPREGCDCPSRNSGEGQ